MPERVLAIGEKVKLAYLGPSGLPRENELGPERLFAWATTPGGDGAPALAFFDADGVRTAGRAVASVGDKVLVLREDGDALVELAQDALTIVPVLAKPLAKGAKIQAYFGCAMVAHRVHDAVIMEVLGDGIGYDVMGDDCRTSIQADHVAKAGKQ